MPDITDLSDNDIQDLIDFMQGVTK